MTPCPSCRRLVRDAACPFCGAAVSQRARPTLVRSSRAALLAAAVVAAGPVESCKRMLGIESSEVSVYGGPPPPSVPPTATPAPDAGTAVPVLDAGAPDATRH